MKPWRLLLIEDNPHDARFVAEALEASSTPSTLTVEPRLTAGLVRLDTEPFDCVLLDLSLPDARGIAAVRTLIQRAPTLPVVILTGLDDVEVASQAVHAGAQDYIEKGSLSPAMLEKSLRFAIQRKRVVEALRASEERFSLAFRATSDGIFDLDVPSGRLFLSPRWYEMLGLSPSPFFQDLELWLERIHPEDRPGFAAALQTSVPDPDPEVVREVRIADADGHERTIKVRWVAVADARGQVQRRVGSQTDVTDERGAAGRRPRSSGGQAPLGKPVQLARLTGASGPAGAGRRSSARREEFDEDTRQEGYGPMLEVVDEESQTGQHRRATARDDTDHNLATTAPDEPDPDAPKRGG